MVMTTEKMQLLMKELEPMRQRMGKRDTSHALMLKRSRTAAGSTMGAYMKSHMENEFQQLATEFIEAPNGTLPDYAVKQMFTYYMDSKVGASTGEQLAWCRGYMRAMELLVSGQHLPQPEVEGDNDEQ